MSITRHVGRLQTHHSLNHLLQYYWYYCHCDYSYHTGGWQDRLAITTGDLNSVVFGHPSYIAITSVAVYYIAGLSKD